ncbi:MAG TPA: glycosyltransferase [Gammaproteobacteria bacterium]|nr:glycosyltransferase [Gammaproteobacteria bacterium]
MTRDSLYRYPAGRLLVFARAPVPGQVKTRLGAEVGMQQAADFYVQMLRATVATALAARLAPVELHVAGDSRHPLLGELARDTARLITQTGDDLGERMCNALHGSLQHADFAVLIGSDCPVMSGDYLTRACERLDAGDEVVLGPAEDGGYVLVGARRCDPELFTDMPWSTDRVMPETRLRLQALDRQYTELETLWDLDTAEDLARWQAEARPAANS